MSLNDSGPEPEPERPGVHYSLAVGREICRRITAGETLLGICRDADMPARRTVNHWVRDNPAFAKMYHRAKVFGDRSGLGRPSGYCPATAHEIAVRVSEGEALSDIARDPAMPAMRTIFHWQTARPEFAGMLEQARWAQAERLADIGWKMALAATPQTARLTAMQLGQLRWTAGIKSPRTHGRLKAAESPAAPEVQTFCFSHFHLETHPLTGQHRTARDTPHPDTMLPARDGEGPWRDPVHPVAKMADLQRLSDERCALEGQAAANPPPEAADDP